MASITINEQRFDVQAGKPLVEVLKDLGFYISNLCYIDGLPAYAGCRTCIVEIEGAPGLPLACSTPVQDGMVVNTDTPAVQEMRQEVMALILANHSDRCLTCHRVEHCRTGDICLRDNVVTHRCVTCSKNYRCELQTASDKADIGRANIEPYLDEVRSYYQFEQPPPDRGNPYLEFDPQMCILCTRCVRACEDLRHTTAISLAGRGFSTRIAFGSGGTIDESNCDFCGACIDVCPTAALMETPNKWVARPEQWVSTTCTECSLACGIQVGVKNGRGVQVRPGSGNDVSRDQICVRGRFGYDQIRDKHRLKLGRLGNGPDAVDAEPSVVIDDAAAKLKTIIDQHGPAAVGLLGSGYASNEDNFLLGRLADVIGTPNLDSSTGYIWGAVCAALTDAFGTEHLPSKLSDVESAATIVVIADDLSASHNVLGVRIKDAVKNRGARLVTISSRRNPIDDYATAEVRPRRGDLAAPVNAIVARLLQEGSLRDPLADLDGLSAAATATTPPAAEVTGDTGDTAGADDLAAAATALLAGQTQTDDHGTLAVIVAPSTANAALAVAQVRAAVNLAIVLAGPQRAPAALHVLPPEANAVGLRDMGIAPRQDGLGVMEMLAAARDGQLKALVVAKDNPLLSLPDRDAVKSALDALDLLLVIDEIATETVAAATHVLPDVSALAKDGTVTSADRQILRLRPGFRPQGSATEAWRHIQQLAQRLATDAADAPAFNDAGEIMDAIRDVDPRYQVAGRSHMLRSARQPTNGAVTQSLLAPAQLSAPTQGMALIVARDLYTDRQAAAIGLSDADRIERSGFLEVHPADAASRGLNDGAHATIRANGATISLPVRLSESVPAGAVCIAGLWDAGAVQALLRDDAAIPSVELSAQ